MSKTRFEQIPLESLKNLVKDGGSKKQKAGVANLIFEPASEKTEPYSRPLSKNQKGA